MSLIDRLSTWLHRAGDVPDPEGMQPDADPGKPVRTGLTVLGVVLVAGMLWAVLAPLDEGVPTQGAVIVDTKSKTVQHQTGGIIAQVLVREAQQVKAGDGLIKLNDSLARANFESMRQRYLGLRAQQGRLQAEQTNARVISFHPDVMAAASDPVIREGMQVESRLFASRRQALASELLAMDEAMNGQEEAAAGFASQLASRKEQLGFVREEMSGLRGLVADGYAPRNKLLELERMAADLGATVGDLQANLAKARRSHAELVARKAQRQQEYRKEVDTQLAEIQREITADGEKLKAAEEELERTLIKAPATGAVVGIAAQTVGGVIQPGARIMDIVPADEMLVLETQIPPHVVDRVIPGQAADVRFNNFADTPQLVVEGRLISVSADLLTDPATHASYYLGRVAVTEQGLKELGNRRLRPGMPVEVVIRTGERSLLTYLTAPLVRRLSRALTEH
jgi:protease secretion system membrane fusion protein